MAESDACLLDTNILLRISKRDDPQQPVIVQALNTLVERGVSLCYTSQTVAEFWNTSTRPLDRNGFGLSVADTDRLASVIERHFKFLPDSRETYDRWRALLVAHNVRGVQVHDARLAASMYVHGIRVLLTLNVQDFRRFPDLLVIHPGQVPETPLAV
ncbi:MAG TPA: PIN domain-containing protein [Candidatus Acidoferrum sp.]|jgi:predicted nucleic acid-binding protein|nr:PIN domain-containing protein [Candidatus Acidoferrum sp.]